MDIEILLQKMEKARLELPEGKCQRDRILDGYPYQLGKSPDKFIAMTGSGGARQYYDTVLESGMGPEFAIAGIYVYIGGQLYSLLDVCPTSWTQKTPPESSGAFTTAGINQPPSADLPEPGAHPEKEQE